MLYLTPSTQIIIPQSFDLFSPEEDIKPFFEMGACNTFTNMKSLNLDSIRESLIRQEDTIIYSLIERSKFPINSPVYTPTLASNLPSSNSLLHFIVHQSEAIQSQVLILTLYIHTYMFVCLCVFFLVFACVC